MNLLDDILADQADPETAIRELEGHAHRDEILAALADNPGRPINHRQLPDGAGLRAPDRRVPDLALIDDQVDLLDDQVDLLDDQADDQVVEKPDVTELPAEEHWGGWRRPGDQPLIVLVLGLNTLCWTPEVEDSEPGPDCPACHGVQLGPRDYCMGCGSSGLDKFLPRTVPRPPSCKLPPPSGPLVGGLGAAPRPLAAKHWNLSDTPPKHSRRQRKAL